MRNPQAKVAAGGEKRGRLLYTTVVPVASACGPWGPAFDFANPVDDHENGHPDAHKRQ